MTHHDGFELSQRQMAAIPFFLGNKSVDEACKEAGISRNAYYEWLKEPAFRDELNRLREGIVTEAFGRLKANATKAVATLFCLMDREDCPAVQRAAANDVLNHLIKFKEIQEIENRLAGIEQAMSKKGNFL